MSDSVRSHRWHLTRLPRPWDSPGKNTGVGCHFLLQHMKVKSESEVTQSCLTLSDPMDCSLPGSSVHGIFQARVLEWGAIAFSTRDYNSHPPRMPVCFPPWEWNRWEKILTGRTENIECQEESTLRSASPSSTGQMGRLTPCKVMKHIRV